MRQGTSSRRARGRGNSRGGRQQNIRNQQMDSNGPGGRVRGTPQQILDRYLALARDATSTGDSVLAENLWQHAEHYTRMLNAAAPQQPQNNQQNASNGQSYQNGRDDLDDSSNEDMPVEPLNLSPEPQAAPAADPAQGDQPAAPETWNGPEQPPAADTPAPAPRRRRRTRMQRQQDETAGSDNNVSDSGGSDRSGSDNSGNDNDGSTQAAPATSDAAVQKPVKEKPVKEAAPTAELPPIELPSLKEKAPTADPAPESADT